MPGSHRRLDQTREVPDEASRRDREADRSASVARNRTAGTETAKKLLFILHNSAGGQERRL